MTTLDMAADEVRRALSPPANYHVYGESYRKDESSHPQDFVLVSHVIPMDADTQLAFVVPVDGLHVERALKLFPKLKELVDAKLAEKVG